MKKIITWIEKNNINYDKINSIVKENNEGIDTQNLVKNYNEPMTEPMTEPMSVETFNYIMNTVKRAPNTFYNVVKIIYNEKTKRWVTKNESYIEEINLLKEENKQLKESMKKFTSTTAEDW